MQDEKQNKKLLTKQIKDFAIELGFSACGIAKVYALDIEAGKLKIWLDEGMHGGMHYMENHFEKKTDPRKLVKNTKSVISVLYNYYPQKTIPGSSQYNISKYAYGDDYHQVLKQKLKFLLDFITRKTEVKHARIFVDSAPVMDKVWAQKCGLGWIGKNTCLINPQMGSFFFIGEIIIDIELDYKETEVKDRCGNCTKCMEACPTGAITKPYVIDARKCISYLTIEHQGELPESLKEKFQNNIFGCDICQDVCPWNRFSQPTKESRFHPGKELINMSRSDWENLTKEKFIKLFRKSPVKRVKFEGLKKNINYLKR